MNKSTKVLTTLALGMLLGATAVTGAFAEEKIEISVTGGSEDAMDLNTAAVGTLNGLSACRHLFEGLYKLDQNGEPVLGQAASVDISDDLLTWTFTLRDDINWSDGSPVVAQDFIFGWDYLLEKGDSYYDLLDSICESYEAPDDKTIIMHLKFPCSYLPSILAFSSTAPARKDYVDEFGDAYATDPEKAVYNGPYKLTEWQHEGTAVMELRDEYYDAANIQVGKINRELISDERTALASFESGDLIYSDMCPDEEKPRMEGNGLFYTSGNNNYCVMFNLGPKGNEVLKDVRVRKALALTIDRNFIIDTLRNINDEIGKTLMCSGYVNDEGVDFTDYAEPWFNVDDYEGNCEEARALLAEAGYPNGEGFPHLSYIVNNDSRLEVANAVISDWQRELGIDSITPEKSESFFASRREGDYDIAYYGWFMDYTDISNMFGAMVTMNDNNCFWTNQDFLDAYNAAVRTSDPKEQWDEYAKCEAALAADLPVSVILHSMNSYLFDDENYDGLVYSCGTFVFTYLTQK